MNFKKARKIFHRRQKQAVNLSQQAEDSIDKLLLGRFDRLLVVRRFVSGWMFFWILLALITAFQAANLSAYFQTEQYVPGGIYNEGILGTMTNVNPIYATNPVDTSLSHLIFAGLFTYNNQNQLSGALASSYQVDKTGTIYTIKLKPDLEWQDGKPLTASDVVYTYDTIQNPDAQSPLYSSWQGIKVTALNPSTVVFTLPNPLASFPYNLTVGILPKHILGNISASNLRSALFNTNNPIGAGPFAWSQIQVNGNTPQNASEQIALKPFSGYILGEPKLQEFIVDAYASKNQLIAAYNSGQLNAMAGLDSVPNSLASSSSAQVNSMILAAGDYVFFRTDDGVLADANVRKALVLAADPASIISQLGYQTYPVNEPFLLGQLAYQAKYAQVTNQPAQASQLLASDGWQMGKDKILSKGGQELRFNLVTTDTPENRKVVGLLKQQWQKIGADIEPVFENEATYTTALESRNYDSTLNGITIGNDPDVFVYWDKSQYDPRSSNLNFSDYNSADASQALEAGRTRLNPALRVIKYQPFLADWQKDAPALGLFQPRFIYITRQNVYGLTQHVIDSPEDRLDNVQNWEILKAYVTDNR